MPPRSRRPRDRQPELSPRSKRAAIEIAPNHRLVQITEEIDWTELEELVQAIRQALEEGPYEYAFAAGDGAEDIVGVAGEGPRDPAHGLVAGPGEQAAALVALGPQPGRRELEQGQAAGCRGDGSEHVIDDVRILVATVRGLDRADEGIAQAWSSGGTS